MKKLLHAHRNDQTHWVGDGFLVRTVFSYNNAATHLSPFLLMDYAVPHEFPASDKPRGVGEHPHRGFETVTIVYSGEVEHRDSHGGGGKIGPGDVQWMTAGAGLVHEEMHSRAFTEHGGMFEMVQLWVNLPAKDKMTSPRYQGISAVQIPKVQLPKDAGEARIIAGTLNDTTGPAQTFTPINLWDVRLTANASPVFAIPAGHTTLVFVLDGTLETLDGQALEQGTLSIFTQSGQSLSFRTQSVAKILILTGEPINEPIAGYGPFVMNTVQEVQQAFEDYRQGRMGQIGS